MIHEKYGLAIVKKGELQRVRVCVSIQVYPNS